MIQKKYEIISEKGLHAKVAVELVEEAAKYVCTVRLMTHGRMVDLQSIMGIMSLGIYKGESISIRCHGADEEIAMERIHKLIIEKMIGKEI